MSTMVAPSIATTADSRVASDLNPSNLGPKTLEKDLKYSSSFKTLVFLSTLGTHNGSPNWATLTSSSTAAIAVSVTRALFVAHLPLPRLYKCLAEEDEDEGISAELATGLPKYFAVIPDIWSIYASNRTKEFKVRQIFEYNTHFFFIIINQLKILEINIYTSRAYIARVKC